MTTSIHRSTTGGVKIQNEMPTEIVMTHEVAMKERQLVQLVEVECFWFGMVKPVEMTKSKEVYLCVYDLVVPKQLVSAASVDLDETVNELMEELIAEDRGDDLEHMRFFAHSHGDLSVYHSTTDIEQIAAWHIEMNVPWFVSHVRNRKSETTTRFDQFSPFRLHVPEVTVHEMVPTEQKAWAEKEVEAKVEKKSYGGSSRSSSGYGFSTGHSHDYGNTPPIQVDPARYPTAFEHYVVVKEVPLLNSKGDEVLDSNKEPVMSKVRQRIIDGYVVEQQSIATGKIKLLGMPTGEQREEEKKKRKIKEGVKVLGRKARASDKPGTHVETSGMGKAAREVWERETAIERERRTSPIGGGSKPLTPAASGVKSTSKKDAAEQNGSSSQKQKQLPNGVDVDAVLSDEEAARAQYTQEDDEEYERFEMSVISMIMAKPRGELTEEEVGKLERFEKALSVSIF